MNLKTASMACLAGVIVSNAIAAEPPVFEPIYQFDMSTYGSINTLGFGRDGRIYSFTSNGQRVIWSIAPNKTAPDLRFIDNPSLPAAPGQSPGPLAISGGLTPLIGDAQGNLFKGGFPNNNNGQPNLVCPYSTQVGDTDPPTYIVNYGFIAKFGPNHTKVEKVSQSTALPICPTATLAIDTSVTPNMLYFISDIKAGSRVPDAYVGTRIYKMAADNSQLPELIHQFPPDQTSTGLSAFLQLVVSQDKQWLYGIKGGHALTGLPPYLFRVKADGTGGYQQLQKFTVESGWPMSQSPGLVEHADYLYLSVPFGGPGNNGGLLRVRKDFTADSELQTLHAFSGGDGKLLRNLTLAGDGNIYGVTYQGGASNAGTIYRIRPADVPLSGPGGVDAAIYSFSGNNAVDGSNPTELLNGPDGKLYGVVPTSGLVYALDIGYVPPAPIFRSFNGMPAQVEWRYGGAVSQALLSWSVENAQNCQLEGPGLATAPVALTDSLEVTPANEGSNVYRLTCDNGSGLPSGTASATFQVNAVAPPPLAVIQSFSVTPTEVSPGGTVRFGWATQNAQTCTGSWVGGPFPIDRLNSGWADHTTAGAEGEQTYVLTCSGRGGDIVSERVTVLVKVGASSDGGSESASINVSDGGGPVTPWLLLPLSLLLMSRRQKQRQH